MKDMEVELVTSDESDVDDDEQGPTDEAALDGPELETNTAAAEDSASDETVEN